MRQTPGPRAGRCYAAARLRFAYRRVLSRDPSAEESRILLGLLEKHQAQFADDPRAADKLLNIGEAPTAAPGDRAELAAWTSVVRILLNLHETITRT